LLCIHSNSSEAEHALAPGVSCATSAEDCPLPSPHPGGRDPEPAVDGKRWDHSSIAWGGTFASDDESSPNRPSNWGPLIATPLTFRRKFAPCSRQPQCWRGYPRWDALEPNSRSPHQTPRRLHRVEAARWVRLGVPKRRTQHWFA